MARNTRWFRCDPDAIFAVLADGWLYPGRVVGASRMRQVADSWPEPFLQLRKSETLHRLSLLTEGGAGRPRSAG